MIDNCGRALLSFLIIICAAAYIGLAIICSSENSAQRLKQHAFPERPATTLILPPLDETAADQVRFGKVKYWKDGPTRKEIDLEYLSGMEEFQYFNEWGIKTSSSQFYPADADGKSRRRSDATFAADGATFASHQKWRRDGSLERSGSTMPGGEYEQKYFALDGKTVLRRRVFTPGDKALKFEEIFDSNAEKLAAINYRATTFGYETDITLFKGGRRTAHFVKNIVEEKGELFAGDGATVIAQYLKDVTMSEEIYMALDGRVVQTRRSMRFTSSQTVTFAASSETGVTYRQVWRLAPTSQKAGGAQAAPASRLLRTVEEIRDGKSLFIARMGKDGIHAESVTYERPAGGAIVKTIGAGGKVLRVTELNERGEIVSSIAPRHSEAFVLPAEALEDPSHPRLPEFKDDAAPPRLYDYP
ncbi:MAG TPA: hypothetical protein PKZ32_04515 [Candidatus Melainabacteria bacterium]|nr:hypothetical protein [Candidatus Melainabacteria bacterium]